MTDGKPYLLRCRICDDTGQFDSVESANDSAWTEISELGAVKPDHILHQAYCPKHSFEDI